MCQAVCCNLDDLGWILERPVLEKLPTGSNLPGSNPREDILGIGKPRGAVALKE